MDIYSYFALTMGFLMFVLPIVLIIIGGIAYISIHYLVGIPLGLTLLYCGDQFALDSLTVLGWIFIIVSLLGFIVTLLTRKENKDTTLLISCIVLILLYVPIVISLIFFHDYRFVTISSPSQHLYHSCKCITDSSMCIKITETDAFLHGYFFDCDTCKEHRKELEKIMRIESLIEYSRERATQLEKNLSKNREKLIELKKDLEFIGVNDSIIDSIFLIPINEEDDEDDENAINY